MVRSSDRGEHDAESLDGQLGRDLTTMEWSSGRVPDTPVPSSARTAVRLAKAKILDKSNPPLTTVSTDTSVFLSGRGIPPIFLAAFTAL